MQDKQETATFAWHMHLLHGTSFFATTLAVSIKFPREPGRALQREGGDACRMGEKGESSRCRLLLALIACRQLAAALLLLLLLLRAYRCCYCCC